MLSQFGTFYTLHHIQSFKFTFSYQETMKAGSQQTYGTGGDVLQSLKKLMSFLTGLVRLELVDLLLSDCEAMNLLDQVADNCCLTLRSLSLVNMTKVPCYLLHPGAFVNLRSLYVSPQNVGCELLELLGQTRLEHLHIVQNSYTCFSQSVDGWTWKQFSNCNPSCKVHLQLGGKSKKELIWQDSAPVSSIVYQSPYSAVLLQLDYIQICHIFIE